VAHASVKLTANASDYHTQMKSAAAQMKELSSEYSLAATRARLTGSAMDALKAKAESLTQKVTVQKNIVQMNREQQERLTEQLGKQKTKQEELKSKVEDAKKAYEDEKRATGEDSDATKALKGELDKLEQEFKENETAIGRTETALSRQTVSTNRAETSLMEMEAELEDVNRELKNHKLNVFADACNKAGQKIEQFGKRMTIVSTGIATFATASAKMAVDFEDSVAKVSTIMDKGVMSVDEMEDAIIGLSNGTGIAAGDIADNVYNAISAGQDTEDAVNFVRKSTKLATAGFADSGDTLDILTTILNAYGLEAGKVTEVSDMLIQTQNLGKTTVSELSSAMGKVIPTANANGVALDQLCAGYAIMTANGVATAETTTYMNSMLNELGKTGSTTDLILREKTGKSFSELMQSGSSLADVLQIIDEAAKEENLTMSDMFSSAEGAKAGLILLGDSADSFNGTLEEMRQSTGATDTAFEKMQTTSYDIKVAMNELKNTVLQFGQTIMSSAAPLVEQFTEKVHTLCEWFGSLDEGQQQSILKIGLFTAAVGPAAIGIGKFAQGISTTIKTGQQLVSGISSIIAKITAKTAATAAGTAADAAGTAAEAAHTAATATATGVTGGMTVAQTALNAVMNLCPIILIVTLIAGLIAAGIALYKNWDKVKEKLAEFWAKIKEVFNKIKEAITEAFSKAKEAVANKVNEIKEAVLNTPVGQAASKVFNGVKNAASKVMTAVKDTVTEKLNNIKSAYEENGGGIKGVVAAGWEGIKGCYTAGFTFVDNLTGGKLSEIKNKIKNGLQNARDTVANVFETIKNVITVALMAIKEIIHAAVTIITLPFRFIWENCKEIVIGVWEVIREKVATAIETVRDTISRIMTGIKTVMVGVWDSIKNKVETVLESLKMVINTVFDFFYSRIEFVLQSILTVITTIWTTVKTNVETILSGIREVIETTWVTVKTNVTAVVNAIKTVLTTIWTAIKTKITTIVNAIKSTITTVWNVIRSKISSVLNAISTIVTNIFNAIHSKTEAVWNAIKTAINTAINTAKTTVSTAVNTIKSTVSNVFNSLKSTVTNIWNGIKSAIETPINKAKTAVQNAIDAIKKAFDFEWSLPDIKLPHFKIEGKFSLNPPSIPSFGVEWYRTGGIMTKPTVFGLNGTRLMAGGEAGAEAILPLSEFYGKLNRMLEDKLLSIETGKGTINVRLDQEKVIEKLGEIEEKLEKLNIKEVIKIVPDDRKLFKIVRNEAEKEKEATGKGFQKG